MIKLFTTETCAPCKLIKYFLTKNDAVYEVIDCTKNGKLLEEASRISGVTMFPQVLFDDGTVVVGANIPRIKEKLLENSKV